MTSDQERREARLRRQRNGMVAGISICASAGYYALWIGFDRVPPTLVITGILIMFLCLIWD